MEAFSLPTLLLIRMLCGAWFVPHVVSKLRDIGFTAENFEKAGFKPARFFVFVAIAMEITAAAGLLFGIYPKLAALIASVILLGAAYATVKIGSFHWAWFRFGMEYLIFWALLCILSAWGA